MKSLKYIVPVGLICLLLGFGVAWFATGRLENVADLPIDSGLDSAEVAPPGTEPTSGTTPIGENAGEITGYELQVTDQPAGNSVSISTAALASDGWLVVYEDRDGALGNILGAGRFSAGRYPDVKEVELLRNTVSGATYYVLIHKDDGVQGFDKENDIPLTDGSGRKIISVFKTTDQGTGACVISGCSAQICSETAEEPSVTTCEFKPEYDCYEEATCARQENGECGWTPTEELKACLASALGN